MGLLIRRECWNVGQGEREKERDSKPKPWGGRFRAWRWRKKGDVTGGWKSGWKRGWREEKKTKKAFERKEKKGLILMDGTLQGLTKNGD